MKHLVYNHLHQQGTPLAKLTLHTAPYKLRTTDSLRHSIVFLEAVSRLPTKHYLHWKQFPYLGGTALSIISQGTDLWSGSCITRFHPFMFPLIQKKQDTKSKLSLLGNNLCSAELYLSTFVTCSYLGLLTLKTNCIILPTVHSLIKLQENWINNLTCNSLFICSSIRSVPPFTVFTDEQNWQVFKWMGSGILRHKATI